MLKRPLTEKQSKSKPNKPTLVKAKPKKPVVVAKEKKKVPIDTSL